MSVVIVITCSSSTPLMGLMAGVLAGAAFPVRHRMAWVRWGVGVTLVCLHMVMKAPVWSLLARVDVVGGSTGFHRYQLVDGAINHFSEWALVGTSDTAHWGDATLADVCMQYVGECVNGGLLTFVLFMVMISMAFAYVGRAWRSAGGESRALALNWGLGAALFVHTINFLGAAYFGQIIFLWYTALALIASLGHPAVGVSRTAGAATELLSWNGAPPRREGGAPCTSW
jgi:hypothetical protein